jgi:predicted nucleic acid-binding protein
LTTVDTSVTVAAFSSWHEQHAVARRALRKRPRLIGHVAVETYAVLTRLPPPHRAPSHLALEFLRSNFSGPALSLPGREYQHMLVEIQAAGIVGGAVYDGLIAATARRMGQPLVTLDRRALPTYQALGATIELLG